MPQFWELITLLYLLAAARMDIFVLAILHCHVLVS